MHVTPHSKKRRILITARLVTVDEGKDWKDENLIDLTGPEKVFYDVSDKVARPSLSRAANAAMAELRRLDGAPAPKAPEAPKAPPAPPEKPVEKK